MSETKQFLFTMSAPPYWHCGQTILKRSLWQLAALTPAVGFAIWNWGMPAARVMALCVAACVFFEAVSCRIMKRTQTIHDLTAVVTGLILAFLLPAASPWWLVVVGALCTMLFGKMLFGGLGNCPFSAPAVGWALLYVSCPQLMDPNLVQLSTNWADPLSTLRYFGWEQAAQIPLLDLALGKQISALGAGQIGALALGGLLLLVRGHIRWQIVLGCLLGTMVPFALVQLYVPGSSSMAFQMYMGSIVLCTFYLATESSIAPSFPLPMFLYGLVAGLLMFAIRTYGSYADGAPFAILVVGLLTPYFDMIRPKPFGVR